MSIFYNYIICFLFTAVGLSLFNPASAQDSSTIKDLNVYPNPGESFTISFDLEEPGKVTCEIFSLTGRKIKEVLKDRYLPEDTIFLRFIPDTSNKDGMYLGIVTHKNDAKNWKLLYKDTSNTCQPPAAAFSYYDSLRTVKFYNTSVKASQYEWNFGNGFQDTAYQPVHQFDSTGLYEVCLKAKNQCGTDTFCRKMPITCTKPQPAFTYDVRDRHVNFFNHSKFSTDYQWHFGDGDSAQIKGPGHQYAKDSVYKVCLEAFNPCGMSDTCKSIEVDSKNTGIQSQTSKSTRLYPNPLYKGQALHVELSSHRSAKFILFTNSGKKVYSKQFTNKTTWPISNLKPGIYHYQVFNSSGQLNKGKLVILP